jgi:flagellar FliL protein
LDKGDNRRKRLAILSALFIGASIIEGAAYYEWGPAISRSEKVAGSEAQASSETASLAPREVFYDLPEMLVNLNVGRGKAAYQNIQTTLVLTDGSAIDHAENVLSRIVNDFQSYLRELRVRELGGSRGTSRVRRSLLRRASIDMRPVPVKNRRNTHRSKGELERHIVSIRFYGHSRKTSRSKCCHSAARL